MLNVFGIGPRRRPCSPSPSEVAQGVGLIPVDSVEKAAGVVGEVASGTFNKDMARDETFLEGHAMNRSKTLSQICDREKVRVCAYGEVFSVH